VTVPPYEAMAELLRTLGHPVRIRVLELLSERDHAVHKLLTELGLEPSNLSQHLAVLRRAGLVHQSRSGGEVVYALVIPETRELLLAAHRVLRNVLTDRDALKSELGPMDEASR